MGSFLGVHGNNQCTAAVDVLGREDDNAKARGLLAVRHSMIGAGKMGGNGMAVHRDHAGHLRRDN